MIDRRFMSQASHMEARKGGLGTYTHRQGGTEILLTPANLERSRLVSVVLETSHDTAQQS